MPNNKYHPLDLCGSGETEEMERQKQYLRDMAQRYKNVFSTPEGKTVLGDILTSCHFGETLNPNDPVEVAEYNTGLAILRSTGFLEVLILELRVGR